MNYIQNLIICAFTLVIVGACNPTSSPLKKAMTFNIRYDNPGDGINQWSERKSSVVDLIKKYNPEVLGIQEGLYHQVTYLKKALPKYSRIGVGRDDGQTKGEFSAIFYDKNKLTLIDESTFWLSEASDRVSIGWDASMERICTYGLFESKSDGLRVWVFNAHYDHIGKIARAESSKLILQKISELNKVNHPVILMGDFNAEANDEPILVFLEAFEDAGLMAKNGINGPKGTFTGFEPNAKADRRIDYIFTKGLEVASYRHIEDKRIDGNYISDHLPVLMESN